MIYDINQSINTSFYHAYMCYYVLIMAVVLYYYENKKFSDGQQFH